MTFVIADACLDVKDRSCVPECPVDCIYEGDRMLYVNPEECVDCGACEAVCPSKAVFYEVDLPADKRPFQDAAVEWVEEHGATGGAKRLGAVGVDHPLVAALPRNPEAKA